MARPRQADNPVADCVQPVLLRLVEPGLSEAALRVGAGEFRAGLVHPAQPLPTADDGCRGGAEPGAAATGAGADATGGAGEDGGTADGRCASADHRWAHHRAVAPHRAERRSGAVAASFEPQLAGAAAT